MEWDLKKILLQKLFQKSISRIAMQCLKSRKNICHKTFLLLWYHLSFIVKMVNLYLYYRVVSQWYIIQKTAGNVRKPASEVSGRFFDSIIFFYFFFLTKESGHLPETSTAGFQRSPDNPSLTDHTMKKASIFCTWFYGSFAPSDNPRNWFWKNVSGHLYASVALGLSRCVGHRPLRLCWSFTLASSFFGFRGCGVCGGRGLSNSASRKPTHRNADRGEYYAAQLDQKPKTCQKLDWKTREIDLSCFCLQRFDKLWKWSVCNEQE